jgi:hypothetical protein
MFWVTTAALEQARAVLKAEHTRRAGALASVVREPPSPRTAPGGWTGPFLEPDPIGGRGAVREHPDHRAAEARQMPPPGPSWRATPSQWENDVLGRTAAAVTLRKIYDTSPIDPAAFDPSTPPLAGPPPSNTTLPVITPIGGLTPGQTLAGVVGGWTGAPTYTRQWHRVRSTSPARRAPPMCWSMLTLGRSSA